MEFAERLENLEKKMDKILELLEKDCKKMSNHIDFVENVYENIKMPFNYLMDRISIKTIT